MYALICVLWASLSTVLDYKYLLIFYYWCEGSSKQVSGRRSWMCVFVGVDSRRRPRLLDCRERRSSVERWIPEAELVLRFRLI